MKILFAIASLALAGCATSAPGGDSSAHGAYTATDAPGGFLVSIKYGRYQFVPESAAVQQACIQALTASAYDEAAKRGRAIQAVDLQRIKVSMGRNILTGVTSCEASAPVDWR